LGPDFTSTFSKTRHERHLRPSIVKPDLCSIGKHLVATEQSEHEEQSPNSYDLTKHAKSVTATAKEAAG
jgi:hypothetical protein